MASAAAVGVAGLEEELGGWLDEFVDVGDVVGDVQLDVDWAAEFLGEGGVEEKPSISGHGSPSSSSPPLSLPSLVSESSSPECYSNSSHSIDIDEQQQHEEQGKRKHGDCSGTSGTSSPVVTASAPQAAAAAVAALLQEDEAAKHARLLKNRESAQLSRQRKKVYVEELEGKVQHLAAANAKLNALNARLMGEVAALQHQLALFQQRASPYAPAPYPNYAPGTGLPMMPARLPLRPLPRPACTVSAAKTKRTQNRERKRLKTTAGAGAAVLCLFGLVFLLLGAGNSPTIPSQSAAVDVWPSGQQNLRAGGRILMSLADNSSVVARDARHPASHTEGVVTADHLDRRKMAQALPPGGNATADIDSNSTVAIALNGSVGNRAEPHLSEAIPMGPSELSKLKEMALVALARPQSPGFIAPNAGMFSSAMCQQIFELDAPGSELYKPQHIPRHRSMRPYNSRGAVPLPPASPSPSQGAQGQESSSNSNKFRPDNGQKEMLVSILVPPEGPVKAGNPGSGSDGSGLSRILVVVLLESAKYVTYSCVLPLATSLVQ
eukprot:jgi/Chlat1/4972/Chrsp32S04954